ncbi:histidine kinase [Clostridium aminobutyricum]|uniref:Histidine kinase n=1 Tax=Clostridium aminobutyricum TaxID=33953 RepID=A0A939D615_CLOAM|nr:histidine kinase [Clostridium aminobutyricum]MBN7772149.1 histidine kinase [Clostridium aminobutyricum]
MQLSLDIIWVTICACFVFFMQAGFTCLEVGFIQSKNVIFVAIENLLTFMITTICFSMIGFPLMFGKSFHELIGTSLWDLKNVDIINPLGFAFVFLQIMFAAVAVTIFAGAMSERTKIIPLQIAAIVSSILIYPVFGHWVWGGNFLDQTTWLQKLGFIDCAGASVVHMTSGFIALAGIKVVGKRKKTIAGRYNIPFATLGVFILWFGWMGFNGASFFAFSDKVGLAILNTNLSASAGMAGALALNFFVKRKGGYLISLFNGVLGGLVAITACSYYCTPISAIALGFVSGVIVDASSDLLDKWQLDDAVNAVPVHLFGGIAGCLLLPFFIQPQYLNADSRMEQFGIQFVGILANFGWVFGISYLMFILLNKMMGLRVTPEEERKGLNIVEFDDYYSWEKYVEISGFEAEIKEKNDLLRKQARLLVTTEEQEKKKLARDLHDGVGQSLAALKLILGLTKRQMEVQGEEKLVKNTEKASQLAEDSIREMRGILNNLKPKALEENDLLGAIQELTESINSLEKIHCKLNVEDPLPHFDETVALNIYRVLQEAVTNVIKHSKANRLILTAFLNKESDFYIFKVEDDGIGFPINEKEFGVGMMSMGDRVKMLGGYFHVLSEIGKGTTVVMEVPVDDGE